MGIKEALQKMKEKSRRRKEVLHGMDEQIRMQRIAEDRQLSSNERELNQLMNEEREEFIKEKLEHHRKKRQDDINFSHNPLDAENITDKTDWEVMKEKNQFANNKNMFVGQKSVLKNDNNLLKNNKRLFSGRCTV